MIEDIPEFQMAEKEISRLKEEVRFYKDRLRPSRDCETGATEDEIDRLQFELDMVTLDKKKFAIDLHDLQNSLMEAIVKINAEKSGSNDSAYNDAINTTLEIIQDCTEEAI